MNIVTGMEITQICTHARKNNDAFEHEIQEGIQVEEKVLHMEKH